MMDLRIGWAAGAPQALTEMGNDNGQKIQLFGHWRYMRTAPVTRAEVSIHRFAIRTVPADACERDKYGDPQLIRELVEPLVEELYQEWRAAQKEIEDNVGRNARDGIPVAFSIWIANDLKDRKPGMPTPWGYRLCRACGRRFCWAFGHSRIRYCSDACIARGEQEALARAVERRSVRRERGRLNKRCGYCGGPIDARRSPRSSARAAVGSRRFGRGRLIWPGSTSDYADGLVRGDLPEVCA